MVLMVLMVHFLSRLVMVLSSDVPEPAGMLDDSDEDWGHWKAPQGRIFNKNRSSISSLFDSSMSSMF